MATHSELKPGVEYNASFQPLAEPCPKCGEHAQVALTWARVVPRSIIPVRGNGHGAAQVEANVVGTFMFVSCLWCQHRAVYAVNDKTLKWDLAEERDDVESPASVPIVEAIGQPFAPDFDVR